MKVKMTNNSNDKNLFECLGICQRLFNFILNNIFFIGLKRVATTSHPMRQVPTTMPILSTAKPNRSRVEHHHRGQSQAYYEKSVQIEARSRGPTKMVGFRDEEGEDEIMRKRKGKGVVMDGEHEEVILQNCPLPHTITTSSTTRQRQVRPLFDVAVNINEKSDAFIRSRKEAMRRNCS